MSQLAEPSRHGLDQVYTPANGSSGVAHIVFVHGLFGHPRKTWSARAPRPAIPGLSGDTSSQVEASSPLRVGGKLDSIFWPKTLLPAVIPDACIFTWGYDADIDGFLVSASQNTIYQHATNLLSDLADFRDFLVDALNQSSHHENPRLKDIAVATFGVCFLGTPHKGSKTASMGKIAYQATVAATRRPNLQLLQALERNSAILDNIAESFGQTLSKRTMQISSFREEMETRKFFIFSTMVVGADSAKIGDRREEVNSIPANHRNMTKFTSATDIGFKRVSAQLRRWVGKIKKAKNDFTAQDYRDCLASLNDERTRVRIGDVVKSHDQTFHWLLDRDAVPFHDWLESNMEDMNRIFWIQGKPGSGKSTLMKYALRDKKTIEVLTRDKSPWTLVGFFFHDRGSGVQKSLSGMLQEILYQILLQVEDLTPFVQPYYAKLVRDQQTNSPIWDVETLRLALVAITRQRDVSACICLFLDALDEHDGDNDQLASLLFELVSNADDDRVRVKVCLASRSWNVFETHFGQCPGFAIHNHTQSDIRKYTMSRLSDSLGSSRLDVPPEKLESITSQVTGKASGVFIWVKLVVDELVRGIRDGTPLSVLEDEVSKMPQELKDLYSRTLKRIEPAYVGECYIMLQIAFCSLRALRLETFIKCTSYTLRGKIAPDESVSQQEMIRRLKSRSGGLLEVALGAPDQATAITTTAIEEDPVRVVQFTHQTVKEFVRDYKGDLSLWGVNAATPNTSGYLYLLRCFVSHDEYWADDIGSDFFEYANLAEGESPGKSVYHVVKRLSNSETHLDFMRMTYSTKQRMAAPFLGVIMAKRSPTQIVGYLAVMAGLRRCARMILEPHLAQNLNPMVPSLLQTAALGPQIVPNQDRIGMINSLLDAGHPIDLESIASGLFRGWHSFPYSRPSIFCTTLALLLMSRIQFPMAEESRLSIARVLLERGAHPNGFTAKHSARWGMSYLHHCARYESADMLRLFLQHGADPSIPDGHGLTPQMYAILRKHPGISQVFSEYEAGRGNEAGGPGLSTHASLVISGCVLAACVGHGKVIGEAPVTLGLPSSMEGTPATSFGTPE
ncbi:hypothetical protein FGG08_000461 [Glutinoglossum americanum]|uniref:Nephrocystin 3-like N-terminal domain-containing protein n=1 Tax=Glutinoglossum americanum TaxID=1670608 RepID=A0A9P8L601_9PEZI|nr:hypothetical protein FGG08_000461 [Glutinoglossum americanum]